MAPRRLRDPRRLGHLLSLQVLGRARTRPRRRSVGAWRAGRTHPHHAGAAEAIGAPPAGDLWSVAMSAPDGWIVRPEVATPVLIVASAYAVGWWQLRRRGGAVSGWRVAASAGGLLSVLVALSSPFDRLA